MPHQTAAIATVAAALAVAFLLGMLASRFKLPPLVGYLAAGVVVGPFTPGYVADAGLAAQLSEVGVILLMFGVGLHFSVGDLAAVRRVVGPGAVLQTLITGTLGAMLALFWGWGAGGAAVLGLSIGVASTVVLLKGLEGRDRLDSPDGRLAVGWLVVEDLMMVLALVLLPAVAPALRGEAGGSAAAMAADVAIAAAKVAGFAALMYFVGRRFVPWLLERVARRGSRELFTLSVLVTALGVGTIASELFGVSFALGAFFAGAVISESELSHRAAADALPMQDAFAVLFFVSVGMLFDVRALAADPGKLVVLLAVVVLWKTAVSYGLLRWLGQQRRSAAVISSALGQIGEFSFIVVGLGLALGLVTPGVQTLVVATAIGAIVLNAPWTSAAIAWADRTAPAAEEPAGRPGDTAPAYDPLDPEVPYDCGDMHEHVVLIGYGRVGSTITDALKRAGADHVVVEEQERVVAGLRSRGERAILGDATRPEVLERAGVKRAKLLVVTAPDPIRARRIVEVARGMNEWLTIAVRTHSAAEQQFFERSLHGNGGGRAVYAEREAALSLAHYALMALGRSDDEADWVIGSLRGQPTRPTETFKSLQTQEYQAILRAAEGAAPTETARPGAP